jgi:hypothetical protein
MPFAPSLAALLKDRSGRGGEEKLDKDAAMIFDEEHLRKIEIQNNESPEVTRLIAQRNQFLREHPQLRSLQKEIDTLMGTTIDPMIRLEILFMLMTDKLIEMRQVFAELQKLALHAVHKK